jgi:hypothetical protein
MVFLSCCKDSANEANCQIIVALFLLAENFSEIIYYKHHELSVNLIFMTNFRVNSDNSCKKGKIKVTFTFTADGESPCK